MNDEIPVVRLNGEVEITRAPSIREELLNAVENQHAGLVADLSGADYLDSAGVNVLFEVAEALREHQIVMALVVPPDSLVDKVVSLVNLSSVAPVMRTLEDALEHIRRSG